MGAKKYILMTKCNSLSIFYKLFIFQSNSKADPHWHEIKGPRGSIILIQSLTENAKLLKQNLNTLVRKSG